MERKKRLFGLALVFFTTFSSLSFAAITAESSPIGYWKTIDDVTGKPKSIVQIWKSSDQRLMGRIIKVFASKGKDIKKVCSACKGDQHNQPIIGMVILSKLQQAKKRWKDGEILDPQNGKKYSCSMQLADQGKKLTVRGYLGLPMFGRSQTWERVDLMSG